MIFPTTALEPGSTNTAAVKQLQDFLVSQGFMTQAQVNTGYGTYGPQTTASVLAYQKAQGVDYSSGPGYWGPKSIAAATAKTSSSSASAGGSSSANNSSAPSSAVGQTFTSSSQPNVKWTLNADGTYNYDDGIHPPAIITAAGVPSDVKAQASSSQTTKTLNASQQNTGSISDFLSSIGGHWDYNQLKPVIDQIMPGYNVNNLQDTADLLNKFKTLYTSGQFDGKTLTGSSNSGTASALSDGYYKVNGAYFKKNGSSVAAVNDSATLNQLQSGQVASKTTASYSDLFASTITASPTPEETAVFNSDDFNALPQDEQTALRGIFDTISTNDESQKAKMQNAYVTATKNSDPYFKTKINLALDQLTRGFADTDTSLDYQEQSLSRQLDDLKTTLSRDNSSLSLDQQNELHTLATNLGQQLDTTRQQLADSGLTQSSRRVKTEALIKDTNAGLVESTNRKFGDQLAANAQKQSYAENDTSAQIEQLTKAAASKKLDLGRSAEAAVGTNNLPGTPGYTPLGNTVGSIPQDEQADIDKAAAILYNNGFVF